jgi:glycine cleavage system aminomethyltransferase T
VCDLTITRLGPDRFWIVTGGAVGPHDLHWIRSHIPEDGSVSISDVTSSRAAVGLWGPRSRALLQKLTEANVSNEAFPYLTSGELYIGGVLTGALRISYAGELGWELYVPMEMGQLFWERLIEAGEEFGLVVAGAGAFDSLRLEKGYRGWGTDIDTDYNPYEAGLGFAVRMNKGDFIGRGALERIKAEGIKTKLCCLTIDDGQVVMGKEPIMDGDSVLGYVTSANYGYSVAKSIAYGYLPIEKSEPGTKVEITYFDERHPATVTPEPLFDPTNARLTH